jgi:MtrB/PioB family decaheme-associated outer membrane protein
MKRNDMNILARSGIRSLLGAVVLLAPALAPADGTPAPDTSRWACKFCQFDEGFSGSVELGAGYVSDDSFKFGEYTGLSEQGGFLVGGADARFRRQDGSWFDLSAVDLGLDSRSVDVAGGRQGLYRLSLDYKELPHYLTESALTPFAGAGGATLTLPGSWVPGGSTAGMTDLAHSLHPADLETHRRRLDFGAAVTPFDHWEFGLLYRHETRSGQRGSSGTFQTDATQLVSPVDYVTDEFNASAAYGGERLQVRLAYYGSLFTNNNQALTWTNPYLPLAPGATAGQLALAPDNQFHQLSLSGGYHFGARTVATADLAAGRMTQNEAFLPTTLNTNLVTDPLPRGSLDGKVDTLSARLRVTSSVTDKLRLNVSGSYDDRNNRTPQATYDRVNTDTSYPADPRTNQPYDFRRTAFGVNGDYYIAGGVRFGVGYDYDIRERNLQDIGRTEEGTVWGRLTARVTDRVDLTLKGAHGDRSVSDFHANPEIQPPGNPVMRKYNMADRLRDTAELRADFMVNEYFSVGLAGTLARDDYAKSALGLTSDHDNTISGDATLALGEKTTATAYLSHEEIRSRQSGANAVSGAATWYGLNNDSIDTGGIGLRHKVTDDLDVGLDYTASYSRGQVEVAGGTAPFPDLTSHLDSVKVYANYRLKPAISLRLAWWYESYQTADWALDGVQSDTIPKVLAFGQGSPNYNVHVVTLSGRYSF